MSTMADKFSNFAQSFQVGPVDTPAAFSGSGPKREVCYPLDVELLTYAHLKGVNS